MKRFGPRRIFLATLAIFGLNACHDSGSKSANTTAKSPPSSVGTTATTSSPPNEITVEGTTKIKEPVSWGVDSTGCHTTEVTVYGLGDVNSQSFPLDNPFDVQLGPRRNTLFKKGDKLQLTITIDGWALENVTAKDLAKHLKFVADGSLLTGIKFNKVIFSDKSTATWDDHRRVTITKPTKSLATTGTMGVPLNPIILIAEVPAKTAHGRLQIAKTYSDDDGTHTATASLDLFVNVLPDGITIAESVEDGRDINSKTHKFSHPIVGGPWNFNTVPCGDPVLNLGPLTSATTVAP